MSICRMIEACYYDKSEMYERRLDTSVSEGCADYSTVSSVYLSHEGAESNGLRPHHSARPQ